MEKIDLKFVRLIFSHTNHGAYALILAEQTGNRRLPVIIGGNEAQAIAMKVENIRTARPLTHDLLKSVCDALEVRVTEVLINDLVEGVFHAKITLEQDGRTVEVDARTSDAIALALRFNCPIRTFEFILVAAGVKNEDSAEEAEQQAVQEAAPKKKNIRTASAEELKQMLHEALEAEDYEGASKLRDELKRREGTN